MREWTEQEEQEMIERAKAGDAEANYELSLWALQRSEEEPDEPRWNRLAAKCLVKAAQAGYAPAQQQMADLLDQAQPPKPDERRPRAPQQTARRPQPEEEDADEQPDEPPQPVRLSQARPAAPRGEGRPRPVQQKTARRAPTPRPDGHDEDGQEPDDEPAAPRRGRLPGLGAGKSGKARPERREGTGKGIKLPFANWKERQWRTVELICMAVCAALIILIIIMLFTGKGKKAENGGGSVPAAGVVEGVGEGAEAAVDGQTAPGQTAGDYPDDTIKAQIIASDLEIIPDDLEYVSVPTNATVSVGDVNLRLRTGPNTDYNEITSMTDGTQVGVYAKKGGWWLVLYNGDTWGWCNSQYLIITEGSTDDVG